MEAPSGEQDTARRALVIVARVQRQTLLRWQYIRVQTREQNEEQSRVAGFFREQRIQKRIERHEREVKERARQYEERQRAVKVQFWQERAIQWYISVGWRQWQ